MTFLGGSITSSAIFGGEENESKKAIQRRPTLARELNMHTASCRFTYKLLLPTIARDDRVCECNQSVFNAVCASSRPCCDAARGPVTLRSSPRESSRNQALWALSGQGGGSGSLTGTSRVSAPSSTPCLAGSMLAHVRAAPRARKLHLRKRISHDGARRGRFARGYVGEPQRHSGLKCFTPRESMV